MTHSQDVDQFGLAQSGNRNTVHFCKHFTQQTNLLIVVGFEQHSSCFALNTINGQYIYFKHPQHGGNVPQQTGSVLMYFIFHIPLFRFHLNTP
ncbi:hypothetical protein D3C76_1601670 [compost metagenome]